MGLEVINQDSVLERALEAVRSARARIWITSPWITQRAVNLLLGDVLPRVRARELDVRIVYRVKEAADLEITDFEALRVLEDAGCEVRYSTRLHAKLLLVDDEIALVSSSNLTATAGYGLDIPAAWRNEELGLVVRDEPDVLERLASEFVAIWDTATTVGADVVGIAMDFPTVHAYSFVAIREVRLGEYTTAQDAERNLLLGRISGITAYNRSFPRMNETMWLTQGFPGGADERRRLEVPDLQSLFSHPSKERGFLVTKTFFEPESVFRVAKVEVLKHHREGRLVAPSVPVAPGSDVTRARGELLAELLGEGEIAFGAVLHHPEVAVALRGEEIVSKHLAVLGMTGSGKSNALKVLVRSFSEHPAYADLRVAIVDTHGEYAPIASSLSSSAAILDVELRRSVLDEETVKELLRLPRRDERLLQKLWEVADQLPAGSSLADLLEALEGEISLGGELAAKVRRLVESARARDDVCLWPDEGARIVRTTGEQEDVVDPGLYVLDLRTTPELEHRAAKAAALMRQVFRQSKENDGGRRALVVLDEAQHYVPEQQTGWLSRVRVSFDAVFEIASEGRKFGVGLVVSTQRPARVNKDVLSQCNTHVIFRVANAEDLSAIAGSFEAASQPLLDELPGFDTGVCVVGGTAIGMVTRVEVPLFVPVPAPAPEVPA